MAVAETDNGLEVIYCVPDEPAAKAGIALGDIIESVDGKPFKKLGDIQEEVLRHSPPSLVCHRAAAGRRGTRARFCAFPPARMSRSSRAGA